MQNAAGDSPDDKAELKPLLTIGYGSQRSADEFVALLRRHGVAYLIDVRSRPYSKFRPEFSKEPLQAMLQQHGFTYHFMGDSLGGIPDDPACYTNGKVDYDKIRLQDWFIRGLDRLEAGWRAGHRIAIMCAELEAHRCHRSKLVAEALVGRDVPVGHVDEQGKVASHETVINRVDGGQMGLFKSNARE